MASCLLAILLAGFVWLGVGGQRIASGHDRPSGPLHKTRSAVMARHGMAATSQPLATATAIRVLQQGGNAIDAAIAANAVLGVVEPMSCGLGGDLFAIVWDAEDRRSSIGLNASGRSPAAATIELFKSKGSSEIPTHGPLSWSVPGCVDGWDQLRKRFGTQALARAARAGDRLRRERLSRQRDHRRRLAARPSRASAQIPTSAACYLPGGTCPGGRRGLPQPGPRPVAPDHRRAAAATPSTRGRSPRRSSVFAARSAAFSQSGLRRAHEHLGRAGLDQLPRLRRLGAAPQRPGDRRASDAQPARAVRPQDAWARNRPRRFT